MEQRNARWTTFVRDGHDESKSPVHAQFAQIWLNRGYEVRWQRDDWGRVHFVAAPPQFWQQRKRAVLSSYMGRADSLRPIWLRSLGNLIRQHANDSTPWITVDGTTCDRWLRAATSGHVPPIWSVRPLRAASLKACERSRVDRWIQAGRVVSWVSGESPTEVARAVAGGAPLPLVDWQLLALAHEVDVLHLRNRGRLMQLLQHELNCTDTEPPILVLLDDPRLMPGTLTRSELPNRLTRWGPTPSPISPACFEVLAGSETVNETVNETVAATRFAAALVNRSWPEIEAVGTCRDFFRRGVLSHWTRAPRDRWPDESAAMAACRLLFNSSAETMTALDSLLRILTMERLIATSHLNRAGENVVCFTAREPTEFPALRRFRKHLRRWDFEPYGISICREWLVHRGAAPVSYGGEQLWHDMSVSQRPWFQLSDNADDTSVSDWSVEAEWRCCGDVLLSELPPAAARVFVPDRTTALRIARRSRWPIVYFGE